MPTYTKNTIRRPAQPRSKDLRGVGYAATSESTATEKAGVAERLAFYRSLWGNPFNGTQDLDGPLTFNPVAQSDASPTAHLEVVTVNGTQYLHTRLPFYSDLSVTAGGVGPGGAGGGGLIQHVYAYADLSGSYSDGNLTDTFNAYTIARIAQRVATLEAGAGSTQWGTEVASSHVGLNVGGTSKNLSLLGHTHAWSALSGKPTTLSGYGITDCYDDDTVDQMMDNKQDKIDAQHKLSYSLVDGLSAVGHSGAYADISGRPTSLSDLTDDILSGHYLSLGGGYLTGGVTIDVASAAAVGLRIMANPTYNPMQIIYPYGTTDVTLFKGIVLGASSEWNERVTVGWSTYWGSNIYNGAASARLGVAPDGKPYYEGGSGFKTIFHAGNACISSVDWICKSLTAYSDVNLMTGHSVRFDSSGNASMYEDTTYHDLHITSPSDMQVSVGPGCDVIVTGGLNVSDRIASESAYLDGLYPNGQNKRIGDISVSSGSWEYAAVKRWYPKAGDNNIYVEYDNAANALKIHGNLVVTGSVVAGQTS